MVEPKPKKHRKYKEPIKYCFVNFTWFEASGTDDDCKEILRRAGVDWFTWGIEYTEKGLRHLQGMAHVKNGSSWSKLKKKCTTQRTMHPLDMFNYCRGPYKSTDGLKIKPLNPDFVEVGKRPTLKDT